MPFLPFVERNGERRLHETYPLASLFVDIVDLKTWLQPSWRTPLVVLAACFLASCTTPPETKLAASEAAQAYRARSLDDPSLRAFAARLDEEYSMWPPALFDAQALHVVALHFSPNITVAKARWHVAQAAVTTAGERQNPTLSLNPLYVTTAAAGMSPWFLSAGLVQLLETGSKRSYRVAHAEYLAEAARLEILAAAWSVLSRVDNMLLWTQPPRKGGSPRSTSRSSSKQNWSRPPGSALLWGWAPVSSW